MKKLIVIKSFWATINLKKNISKTSILLIGLLTIFMFSCNDEKQFLDLQSKSTSSAMKINGDIDKLYNERSTIQREFSKSLAKSLKESKMLREIIKKQALEMFNDDYEVLYEMIRDERIENNLTVDDLITKNLGDKKSLKKIDSEYPTLTILVPSLPNEVFSANKWDIDTEIPKIAVRLSGTNDVPIINSDGSENILEGKYTPGFPVLVVKESERVISNKHESSKNIKTRTIESKRGAKYKFLSDEFDRKLKKNKRFVFDVDIAPKLITAYDTYKNVDGWHRDLIYYDITPNQPKGPFIYDFQDGVTLFRMTGQGNPQNAINKISDQADDPHNNSVTLGGPQWTEGFFEFKVTTLVNAKNGVGAELNKYFGASPSELFELSYTSYPWFGGNTIYILNVISLREKEMRLPIFNWDLDNYATTVKVSIEEVDISTTEIKSESTTVKFASNFGIEGVLKKIGLKFGASIETTQTQTYQKTYKLDNDPLGDVTINFADDVIIQKVAYNPSPNINNFYLTREYDLGWCSISYEPIKVQ